MTKGWSGWMAAFIRFSIIAHSSTLHPQLTTNKVWNMSDDMLDELHHLYPVESRKASRSVDSRSIRKED
jgi:hypothetical protein